MFKTLDSFETEFSADSVEWCPTENFQDIFVCGTYQLTEDDKQDNDQCVAAEKRKRVGRIYVFQVVRNEKAELKLLQRLDVPAVLDMKWAHVKCSDKVLLGVVNSIGFLQIYELMEEKETIVLKFITEISVDEKNESTLALSLDWSTGIKDECSNNEPKITVSDSQGTISLFKVINGKVEKVTSWHAHEYEAWITAFDYWNTNVVYTGGDDCKFLRFDTRAALNSPTNTNRLHNAGVTSLHSNWKKEFCLVSGSYDETLRTWDTRNLRRPVSELNLGGGLWRLKWEPREAEHLLAAGMYSGFFAVGLADPEEQPQLLAEYREHESIAYGCDWSHLKGAGAILVATCSFYDHLLKLSELKLDD